LVLSAIVSSCPSEGLKFSWSDDRAGRDSLSSENSKSETGTGPHDVKTGISSGSSGRQLQFLFSWASSKTRGLSLEASERRGSRNSATNEAQLHKHHYALVWIAMPEEAKRENQY
jgi:hypothetical protein